MQETVPTLWDLRQYRWKVEEELGGILQGDELVDVMRKLAGRGAQGVLEIGSWNGGSMRCWMGVCGPPYVSVDWKTPPDLMGRRDSVWTTQVIAVHMDSQRPETAGFVGKVLRHAGGDGLVDWLFIDGQHTGEGAWNDFEQYRQFVRPGGMIGVHDIRHPKFPEIGRHWERMKAVYPRWETIDHSTGMGLLYV